MAGRLVDVGVDGDVRLEGGEGGVEPAGVGRRQHRVAGHRDEAPDLALAGRVDLLGQADDRQLAERLRAGPAPGWRGARGGRAGPTRAAPRVLAPPAGRLGEHGAAGAVEVAGGGVDHVDEPGGQGAELGGGGADPPVDAGGRGGGQLAGQPADGVGRDAGGRLDGLRGERRGQPEHVVEPAQPGPGRARVDQPLGGQHVEDGEEQEGVAAGPDGDVLVGQFGGAGPPGVDHHHPPAPGLEGARAGRASRARWRGSRWTRAGWPRAGAGGRSGRRRGRARSAARRTGGRRRSPWAAGRRCWR